MLENLANTQLTNGQLLEQLAKMKAAGYEYVATAELNGEGMMEYRTKGLEALTVITEAEYETLLANETRRELSEFACSFELFEYLDNRVENYYESIDDIASRICRLITRQWNITEEQGA